MFAILHALGMFVADLFKARCRLEAGTLMALFFGLFSMPVLQAAPANGWAVGSALKDPPPLAL